MDEILIEDRKYVSSKQAAKITGYAKDYIGQLCREGRVPARLVGRTWYVLESAIQDHRFGDEQTIKTSRKSIIRENSLESPRYEAGEPELLPTLNGDEKQNASFEQPHDPWKSWFDRIASTEPVGSGFKAKIQQQEAEMEEPQEQRIDDGVEVPIHTLYDLPPKDLLPQNQVEEDIKVQSEKEETQQYRVPVQEKRANFRSVKVFSILIAGILLILAALNTGIIDKYTSIANQIGLLSGMFIYNSK